MIRPRIDGTHLSARPIGVEGIIAGEAGFVDRRDIFGAVVGHVDLAGRRVDRSQRMGFTF